MTTYKFQLYCSCIYCHQQTTAQNIISHFTKHHTEKIKNPKSFCPQCNSAIFNKNKFCSHQCSAIYTNARKDYTKIKTGPLKGSKPKIKKIKTCEVCNNDHSNFGCTCSTTCKSVLLSNKMKERIANGFNPNKNRGRQKRSWLETSFEQWVNINYPNIKYEAEQSFKRLDYTKTYFADFYFPELSLIIELDGTQHNLTQAYDIDRDNYISNTYNIKILRISHKEYKSKSRKHEIIEYIERATGIKPAYDN